MRTLPISSLLLVILLSACSLNDLVSARDPERGREIDRSTLYSGEGAIGVLNSARRALSQAMNEATLEVAVLTDELQAVRISPSTSPLFHQLDSRTPILAASHGIHQMGSSAERYLHNARVRANQARGLIRDYSSEEQLRDLMAYAYSIEGFSLLMFAEMFCSGIAITDVDLSGNISFQPELSTTALMEKAMSLFDSALFVDGKDSSLITLATIGKARALLGLGRMQDVLQVLEGRNLFHRYTISYIEGSGPEVTDSTTASYAFWTGDISTVNQYQVTNLEGGNGIRWMSTRATDQDPRVPITLRMIGSDTTFDVIPRQEKFRGGSIDLIIADQSQAHLMVAEAKLFLNPEDPGWLNHVNEVRRSVGLTDTVDPGEGNERIDLLFRERAFTMYLTGSRLGDFRRLIRIYGRRAAQVYPQGAYTQNNYFSIYGDVFVFSPNLSELNLNPLYAGCLNRAP